MEFELIVAIVERGKALEVVKKAAKVGAGGGTILYARGAGRHMLPFFQALQVDEAKEVILILVTKDTRPAIFEVVCEVAEVEGTGAIAFVIPVSACAGLRLASEPQDE